MKTRNLPVKLTTEEILRFGDKTAKAVEDLKALEEAHKARKADMKQAEDTARRELRRLSKIRYERVEYRDVEVNEVHNASAGTVSVYRTDTNELVDERAMTGAELREARQTTLPVVN